ncbi:hypothetical protein BHM03_00026127 [Ensete ventricosum]|nr:hypothetical protein BHM03_00026127 [Ensete ventricosum]
MCLAIKIRHKPRIKLRHRAKDWTMQREHAGSSLGDSLKGSGSCWETLANGEDEGSQVSSSLAVSTRWISTTKLLQSELATLA